jgi:CheY-specific phosphatase CheX
VYVGLGIDQATGKRLGGLLLGGDDASEEAIHDMVRELANVAAGAVKRRLLADGHVFKTGLPIDTELGEFRAPKAEPIAQKTPCRSWVMSLPDDATVKVCCEIELRLVRT